MATQRTLETWLVEIGDGDRAALARLYEATAPRLFGVCLRLLGNRGAAEAALEDILVRIGRDPVQFRAVGLDPLLWMLTVARNHCTDLLRGRRAAARAGRAEADDALSSLPPGPAGNRLARHHAAAILDSLDGLDPVHSEALRRAYLEGETLRELSARFDLSPDVLGDGLRDAILWLRADLHG
ncbi:sigma factor [Jannaschia pohangensis]|nr:sigma factor [Jannaschia pohangensis]